MSIPLCKFIVMPIVRHALKIDVLKWSRPFKWVTSKGRMSYFSPTNWQGDEIDVSNVESSWGPIWKEKNDRFEEFL
jgi:hypothetical protein